MKRFIWLAPLLTIVLSLSIVSCKKEQEQQIPEKKQLRVKVENLDIKVLGEFSFMDENQNHFKESSLSLGQGESKYFDIPKNAVAITFYLNNMNPMSTSSKERKEFKVKFTISDYNGKTYHENTEVSQPVYELRSGQLFYTPNSKIVWGPALDNFYK
ncbi:MULTISPECIES: hypothetical protein [Sphingobacterium]|uniref:hypothetical protein n=1 Tax=Sphingobacterium TaxID=28453 RepID=UPI002580016A|nr:MULTISPECIES: hypothetical protein [Sphingobacterium]